MLLRLFATLFAFVGTGWLTALVAWGIFVTVDPSFMGADAIASAFRGLWYSMLLGVAVGLAAAIGVFRKLGRRE